MNAMEKITGQINADTQREIDARMALARSEAQQIVSRCAAQAQTEGDEILRRGRESAVRQEERLGSVAGLEARKSILSAKQELVSRAFNRALERLLALDEEAYINLLVSLAVKASRTGKEQVYFSKKDRTRIGKAVVTKANEQLAKQVAPKLPEELTETRAGAFLDKVVAKSSALLAGTGMLTLAEETRTIQGGLILSDGDVETNCSFEALMRLQRDNAAGAAAKVLFE